MKKDDLRRLLDGVPSKVKQLVLALRNVVRRNVPQAKESPLWGGLSYHRPEVGGRVKGAVCQINFKGGQVRLEFIHGIRLPDPSGLLRGNLISKRFVLIETAADAERPEIGALIRKAATLDPVEWAEPAAAPDRGCITALRGSNSTPRHGR